MPPGTPPQKVLSAVRNFARHLRAQGVAANATDRAARGECRKSMKDGIYRANCREASTYMRAQAQSVAKELAASGSVQLERSKQTLLETRAAIQNGWQAVAEKLAQQDDRQLSADVARFTWNMERPLTDREWIARSLLAVSRARRREARTL